MIKSEESSVAGRQSQEADALRVHKTDPIRVRACTQTVKSSKCRR